MRRSDREERNYRRNFTPPINGRTVKNHIIRGLAVTVNPADVVIHLNAVVKLGGGILEEDFVGAVKPQRTVRLLFAMKLGFLQLIS